MNTEIGTTRAKAAAGLAQSGKTATRAAKNKNGKSTPTAADVSISGAAMIWHILVEEGIEVVFGYPGGAIMPAYDALPKYPVHHVLVRHEQSAAHMADGYARASGEVGVVIATSGPGATNLVTGIANAMLDSIPVVFITGQVPSHLIGSDAFQETDVCGVTLPITKHNYLVTRAEDIAPTLREAFELARSGRHGPVLVDITKDAQLQQAKPGTPAPFTLAALEGPPEVNPGDIDKFVALLAAAERPIVLSGHGIIKADATAELLRFVERSHVPVTTTLLGLGGFPASHPKNLGMLGMHGTAWANKAVQDADLVIALGMRFDDRVTGDLKQFAVNAQKIHVELDASEINKNVRVDLGILGDVGKVMTAVNERLAADNAGPCPAAWNAGIADRRTEESKRDIINLSTGDRLLAAQVLHDLWRITGGTPILSTDVGQHQMWAAQYFKHERPRSLLTSGGLGTMGFALPAAIGARFARPDDEIWVVAGDGGFQMTAPELTTLAQEDKKVNIAIINNGYLGMVRQWQEMFFDRRYIATPISSPDFVLLAEAHGHEGIRVTTRAEVEPAIRRARESKRTVLIDFVVQAEDIVYPMVPAGRPIDRMIRRPEEKK